MVFTESIYPHRGWSFDVNRGIINQMSLSQLPSINRLLSDARLADLPHALAKRAAREVVDGMPYAEWKARHQTEATPEQQAQFAASHKSE